MKVEFGAYFIVIIEFKAVPIRERKDFVNFELAKILKYFNLEFFQVPEAFEINVVELKVLNRP